MKDILKKERIWKKLVAIVLTVAFLLSNMGIPGGCGISGEAGMPVMAESNLCFSSGFNPIITYKKLSPTSSDVEGDAEIFKASYGKNGTAKTLQLTNTEKVYLKAADNDTTTASILNNMTTQMLGMFYFSNQVEGTYAHPENYKSTGYTLKSYNSTTKELTIEYDATKDNGIGCAYLCFPVRGDGAAINQRYCNRDSKFNYFSSSISNKPQKWDISTSMQVTLDPGYNYVESGASYSVYDKNGNLNQNFEITADTSANQLKLTLKSSSPLLKQKMAAEDNMIFSVEKVYQPSGSSDTAYQTMASFYLINSNGSSEEESSVKYFPDTFAPVINAPEDNDSRYIMNANYAADYGSTDKSNKVDKLVLTNTPSTVTLTYNANDTTTKNILANLTSDQLKLFYFSKCTDSAEAYEERIKGLSVSAYDPASGRFTVKFDPAEADIDSREDIIQDFYDDHSRLCLWFPVFNSNTAEIEQRRCDAYLNIKIQQPPVKLDLQKSTKLRIYSAENNNIYSGDYYKFYDNDGKEVTDFEAKLCENVDKALDITIKEDSSLLQKKITKADNAIYHAVRVWHPDFIPNSNEVYLATFFVLNNAGSSDDSDSDAEEADDTVVSDHVFRDSSCTELVKANKAFTYANGAVKKDAAGNKVSYKSLTYYTDLKASDADYTVTDAKGKTKNKKGKLVIGVTTSSARPTLANNKFPVDADAKKMVSASYKKKDNSITITAKSTLGTVYVWVMTIAQEVQDVGYVKVHVKNAPTKLEFIDKPYSDTTAAAYKKDDAAIGDSVNVYLKPTISRTKELVNGCGYTLSLAKNMDGLAEIEKISGSEYGWKVTARALKNNKKTNVKLVAECTQNNKKANFTLTVLNYAKGEILEAGDSNVKSISEATKVTGTEGTGEYNSYETVIAAPTENTAVSANIKITSVLSSGSFSATDKPKIYAISSEKGFSFNEKGKLVIQRATGDSAKIKASIKNDIVTIKAPKKLSGSTKSYFLVVYNTYSSQGYFVIPVSLKAD